MTKKEALKAKFQYPVKETAVDVILLENGVTSDADFTGAAEEVKELDICLAGLILLVLTGPQSESEGGYSISMGGRESLLKTRSLILSKYGIDDGSSPSVKDISDLW